MEIKRANVVCLNMADTSSHRSESALAAADLEENYLGTYLPLSTNAIAHVGGIGSQSGPTSLRVLTDRGRQPARRAKRPGRIGGSGRRRDSDVTGGLELRDQGRTGKDGSELGRARAGAPFTIGSIAFDRGPPLDENQMCRVFIVDKHLDAEAPVERSGSREDVPKH